MNRKETPAKEPHQQSFIETARRRQIIDCAIETIAEVGLAQASLARIAKRAAIGTSVILYYFQDKEELQQEVLRHSKSIIATFITERIRVERTATLTLSAYVDAFIYCYATFRKESRALLSISQAQTMARGTYLTLDEEEIRERQEGLHKILRWGQESGEFRLFDVPAMAIIIIGFFDHIPSQIVIDPTFDFDIHHHELREMIKRAVLKDVNNADFP